MPTTYTLRPGAKSDFDQLFEIYMHPSVNRYLNFEILSKQQFKLIFDELFNGGQLYVYAVNDLIVATCIVIRLKRRCNHIATLSTLATHPQYHGKGIGTKFIQEIIAKMQADGIKRIDLYAETDNPGGLAFYRKLGFQQEGVLTNFLKRATEDTFVDEVIMALILD